MEFFKDNKIIQTILNAPLKYQIFFCVALVVVAFAIYAFASPSTSKTDKSNPFLVDYPTVKGPHIRLDVKRGLAIFGAAGAGKSRSGFIPIYKTCSENRLSVVNYDYKDFELTEFMNYFYQDTDIPVYNIAPARPDFSHCINPIDPKYIQTFNDINSISTALIANLSPTSGDNQIFSEIAESALAGVIQRTKEDYPELCNLPMIAAILMRKTGFEVIEYIEKSQYASLLGKPFMDSSLNEKLFGSVTTTISNALRKIISPEIFKIFGKSDFDLAINKPENVAVLNVVNHPKYDTVLAPFLAVVIQCTIMQMQERNRNPSLVVLDEASTIKLNKMERIPATLRSYDIGTIFGMQDKIQGVDLYGENKLKAILANLGAKLLGKANDSDTTAYYEKLFELIKEDQKSISRGSGWSSKGETRESISQRERAKHRAYEFMQLEAGNFFVFDEKGKSNKVKFKELPCNPVKTQPAYNYSKTELELNFKNVLEQAKNLE